MTHMLLSLAAVLAVLAIIKSRAPQRYVPVAPARPAIDPHLRSQVMHRNFITEDGVYFCTYCFGLSVSQHYGPDGSVWELDHIMPFSHGGPTVGENLTLACHTCNYLKGASVDLVHAHPQALAAWEHYGVPLVSLTA